MRPSAAIRLLLVVVLAGAGPASAAKPKKPLDSTPPTITHLPPGSCPRAAPPTTTPATTPPATTPPATTPPATTPDVTTPPATAPAATTPPATAPAATTPAEPPPCAIEATIVDDSGVFDPTLLYRLKGGAAFDRVAMKPRDGQPDVYAAVVPAPVVAAGDVEYLIEAFDVEGNGPARAGTEAGPLALARVVPDVVVVAPPPPPPPPEESNTGLIIGVVAGVAVVLAASVGVGVAIYALRPPANDTVTVTVDGPAPFQTLAPLLAAPGVR